MEDNIVEVDWTVFMDEWRRYRRSCLSQATPQEVADQLKSCCSKSLRRSIFSQSQLRELFKNNTYESKILTAIRDVAVKNIPKKVDEFLCLYQLPEENIDAYAARLTRASLPCNFVLPQGQTIYTEQMIKHQLIKGLYDNEIRIQTIQTISKKEHVSLVETLNVIRTKKAAKDEADGSKPNIKSEYHEEPDTTQMDIKIENESHDQRLQPPSPINDSTRNQTTDRGELYHKNLLLAPSSPSPSTVSTIAFSPFQSQNVSGNLVDKIHEDNIELKGRITTLEEDLAAKVDAIRGIKEIHRGEITVLELQLKLKFEAVERLISTSQNDKNEYETKINDLQEKEKDNKIQSEIIKKKMLLSLDAAKQMQEERNKALSALAEIMAEKEDVRGNQINNWEEQRNTQHDHNEEMEKITVPNMRVQTKLDESAEEKNKKLKALNETLKERAVSFHRYKSQKRKHEESVQEDVTEKKTKYEVMHESNSEYILLVLVDIKDNWDQFPDIYISKINDVHMRIKPTAYMSKLKDAYSDKTGISLDLLQFNFKGQEIKDSDTPEKLSMSNNEVIHVTNISRINDYLVADET